MPTGFSFSNSNGSYAPYTKNRPNSVVGSSQAEGKAPAGTKVQRPKLPSISTMMGPQTSNEPPRPQSSFAFGPPYGQQTSNMPQSASLGQAPNTRTSTQGLPSGAPAFSASLTTPQKDMARSQSSFSFKRSSFNEKSPNSSPYGPIANSAPYSGGSKSLSGTSFTCDKCGQNYVRISDLLTHSKVHDESRPFSCSFCQLRFTRKFDQQRHERSIHTGERPFKCNRCSAEFSRSDALTRHLRLEGQCSPSSTAPDEPSATSASSTTSSDFAFKASPQRRSSFAMPSMGPVSVSPSVRSASPLEQFRENLQQQRRNTPSPTASMAASSPLKFPSKLSFMMNPATTTPTTGTRSRTSSFTFV